jgi:hypothetical protein
MSEDVKKSLLDAIAQESEHFQELVQQEAVEMDQWWDSLPQEDQMRAFYSVVKRLVKGELRDRGTYRYVLYDIFGFDASSYMMGMNCGYMELHNSIYTHEEMRELRDRELAAAGVKVITSKVVKKETEDK